MNQTMPPPPTSSPKYEITTKSFLRTPSFLSSNNNKNNKVKNQEDLDKTSSHTCELEKRKDQSLRMIETAQSLASENSAFTFSVDDSWTDFCKDLPLEEQE
jgi:hypothetical protein